MVTHGKNVRNKSKNIKIRGEGKYPLIPILDIEIAERPRNGESLLFYNPRSLQSFTPEKMDALLLNVRLDGLQQPPIVRAFTEDKKVFRVQLIAGERRLRTCRRIYDEDLPCYDDDAIKPAHFETGATVIYRGDFWKVISHDGKLGGSLVLEPEQRPGKDNHCIVAYNDVIQTSPGRQVFEFLPCRVQYNCTDERALRLAFSENDKSDPLSISDEVGLVERLLRQTNKHGQLYKQEEIAELLGMNVTWVSQTANFREQLPSQCFEKLLNGTMTRHVAVGFLRFKPEDREKLFQEAMAEMEKDNEEKIESARAEVYMHEDNVDLLQEEAEGLEKQGNQSAAAKTRRRVEQQKKKADKAKEKLERAKQEEGTLKTGHLHKAVARSGAAPRRGNILSKEDIEQLYVKDLVPFATNDKDDPVTGKPISPEHAALVRRTAQAILQGNRDPLSIIREYNISNGYWDADDNTDPSDSSLELEDDSDDEPKEDEFEEEDRPRRGRRRLEEDRDVFGDFDPDKFEREWN